MMKGRSLPAHRLRIAVERLSISLMSVGLAASAAWAGPFTDAGHAPTPAMSWPSAIDQVVRGPIDIAQPQLGLASFGSASNALGAATGDPADVVSLGDGGSARLYFDPSIGNGPGDDFAVFENGFFDLNGLFAELAYIEVSTDGIQFARFDSDALNAFPVLGLDTIDPTDYHGLGGRHPLGIGTGFDLADLDTDPLVISGAVDLYDIRYVRVVDVIGDGSTLDGGGNPIYDPYSTAFSTGGFDLEALGAIHVPEPTLVLGLAIGLLALAIGPTRTTRRRISGRFCEPVAIALALTAFASPAAASTSTFEDLGLGADAFDNGSDFSGGFTSGGVFFENSFTDFGGGCCYSGYAASTTTDTTTPGPANQFSNITGSGAGGSSTFGIAFSTGSIILPAETVVLGAEFTNTTYAALSMLNGDGFAKAFGGVTGDDEDFFRLLIEGVDATGSSTGSVDLLLADYRFADNSQDFILDEWVLVDLSGLGLVKELRFSFESSDLGMFGINTPQYFAIDNLTTIPEPGTALLVGAGLVWLARRPNTGRFIRY